MKRFVFVLLLVAFMVSSVSSQDMSSLSSDALSWMTTERSIQWTTCYYFVNGYVTKVMLNTNDKLNGRPLSSYSSSAKEDEAALQLFLGRLVEASSWIPEMADLVTDHLLLNPDDPLPIAMWEAMHMVALKYYGSSRKP